MSDPMSEFYVTTHRTSTSNGHAERLSRRVKQMFDHLIRLLTATDTTLAEFGSSTTLIYVGAILSLPQSSLIRSVPIFDAMLHVMPEPAWSICFLALGIFQAMVNLTRSHAGRRYAAFMCFACFAVVGGLGAWATPVSLLGAVCKVNALVQGLVYLHLGVRRGEG